MDNKEGKEAENLRMEKIMKKTLFAILGSILIICALTACGNDNLADEMVRNGQAGDTQNQNNELEAGSNYVENNMENQKNRTFSTLSKLRESVKAEMGEQYWPEMLLSETELEEKTGITPDMYVEFIAEKQVLDANIDTMIIIHAKEEYVGKIEQSLETYRNNLIKENEEYPQNYGKAKASRMETIEDYICFVQLGADTTVVADKGEEEIIAYCQEENERALHILEKEILQ